MDDSNEHGPALGQVLGLAGTMLDDRSVDELLQKVVLLVRHTVRAARAVSITVAANGGFRTSNSTAAEALAIDEAQYEGGEGPCLEAMRTARQVEVVFGSGQHHWPRVQARAQEFGIASVLSTPLRAAPDEAIGALNIYSEADGGFGIDDRRTAEFVGEHAAVLVGNALALVGAAQLNEQLRSALASREIIGEAKGIIMERQSCTRDEAFDILRRASQRENRKLRDLAEELVQRVEARRGKQAPP